jgi:hypothetical protein
MRSFISNFRAILIAVAAIAGIEAAVWAWGPEHHGLFATNFFELAYMRQENPVKVQQAAKLYLLPELSPRFIQVGDSSGFHGGRPDVIEQYVKGPYLILSCCGDMGYAGHRYVAEASVARDPKIEYIVFYVTPHSSPINWGNLPPGFAESYESAFLGFWRHLDPPSLNLRHWVTSEVYYGTADPIYARAPDPYLKGTLAWLRKDRGWVPHNRPAEHPVATDTCRFDRVPDDWLHDLGDGDRPFLHFRAELTKLATFARENGKKLVLVFNPVACQAGEELATVRIEREIALFRMQFPEVAQLTHFITTWPQPLFSDQSHLNPTGSERMGHLVGTELAKVVADPTYRGIPPPSLDRLDAEIAKLSVSTAGPPVDEAELAPLEKAASRVIARWANPGAWTPMFLSVRAADAGGRTAIQLVEDAAMSYRNLQTRAAVVRGKPVRVSVDLRAGRGVRAVVMLYDGKGNRIACPVDPETGVTSRLQLQNGEARSCLSTKQGRGWWRVNLLGQLADDGGDPPVYLAVALVQQGASEYYQGNGHNSLYVGEVAVFQDP